MISLRNIFSIFVNNLLAYHLFLFFKFFNMHLALIKCLVQTKVLFLNMLSVHLIGYLW